MNATTQTTVQAARNATLKLTSVANVTVDRALEIARLGRIEAMILESLASSGRK